MTPTVTRRSQKVRQGKDQYSSVVVRKQDEKGENKNFSAVRNRKVL